MFLTLAVLLSAPLGQGSSPDLAAYYRQIQRIVTPDRHAVWHLDETQLPLKEAPDWKEQGEAQIMRQAAAEHWSDQMVRNVKAARIVIHDETVGGEIRTATLEIAFQKDRALAEKHKERVKRGQADWRTFTSDHYDFLTETESKSIHSNGEVEKGPKNGLQYTVGGVHLLALFNQWPVAKLFSLSDMERVRNGVATLVHKSATGIRGAFSDGRVFEFGKFDIVHFDLKTGLVTDWETGIAEGTQRTQRARVTKYTQDYAGRPMPSEILVEQVPGAGKVNHWKVYKLVSTSVISEKTRKQLLQLTPNPR